MRSVSLFGLIFHLLLSSVLAQSQEHRYQQLYSTLVRAYSEIAAANGEGDVDFVYYLWFLTNGPNWKQKANWMQGLPCQNNWFGVTCDKKHIIEIKLSNNNIQGTLPSSLSLPKLRVLDLSQNQLSGRVDGGISFPELEILDLDSNKLSGSLPPDLSKFPKLRQFRVSNNQFIGALPQLSGAASLEVFSVSFNKLDSLFQEPKAPLPSLQILDLSNNKLHGTLPQRFEFFPNLVELRLNDNEFVGNLPTSIIKLVETLKVIFLTNNRFDKLILPKRLDDPKIRRAWGTNFCWDMGGLSTQAIHEHGYYGTATGTVVGGEEHCYWFEVTEKSVAPSMKLQIQGPTKKDPAPPTVLALPSINPSKALLSNEASFTQKLIGSAATTNEVAIPAATLASPGRYYLVVGGKEQQQKYSLTLEPVFERLRPTTEP